MQILVINEAEEGDVVLALISGGGSALLPAPPSGVSLQDKQALNRILLKSGLDIVAMNMIRQQVSQLKGGGMARLAAPAKVTAFILSDVVGDDTGQVLIPPDSGSGIDFSFDDDEWSCASCAGFLHCCRNGARRQSGKIIRNYSE